MSSAYRLLRLLRCGCAEVECNHCHTTQCVDMDEDGDPDFMYEPCPICGAKLCCGCEHFDCDGCGQTFCLEHLAEPAEWNMCPVCAKQAQKEESQEDEYASRNS